MDIPVLLQTRLEPQLSRAELQRQREVLMVAARLALSRLGPPKEREPEHVSAVRSCLMRAMAKVSQ